jgi:ribosomal protein L39E
MERRNNSVGHPPFNAAALNSTVLKAMKKNQTRATGAWTSIKSAKATGTALARRHWEDKDSFAYLWASNMFKYGFIGLIVLVVAIIAIMIIRYRRKRAAAGY